MIFVDLRGNLGNQIFIYAFARKIQKKTGQKITLSTYNEDKYYPGYHVDIQNFLLNDNVIVDHEKYIPFYMDSNGWFLKVLLRLFPVSKPRTSWIWKAYALFLAKFGKFFWLGETYLDLPVPRRKDYFISGFWQSEKYFPDLGDALKEELIPRRLSINNSRFEKTIIGSESICVTIRRGDYVANPVIRKQYLVCTPDYYRNGVKKITEQYPNAVVICFSDDIEWVKGNIDFGRTTYYESGNDSTVEKIWLMSRCKHFVLSNSSFSWWAAYLSGNKNGEVIAPPKWYADGRPTDVYRSSWTKLV
jgi:hypothetical protein